MRRDVQAEMLDEMHELLTRLDEKSKNYEGLPERLTRNEEQLNSANEKIDDLKKALTDKGDRLTKLEYKFWSVVAGLGMVIAAWIKSLL